jgi:ankyrin repeat protein
MYAARTLRRTRRTTTSQPPWPNETPEGTYPMTSYDPLRGGYSHKDSSIDERVDAHFRTVSLPLQDAQGMMRHILDSLGALKVRMDDPNVIVAPFLIRIFADSVRMIMDHLTGFEPIDNESAIKFLLQSFPDDTKRGDGRQWLPVHWAAAIHNTEPEHMEKILTERPVQLIKGHLHFDEKPPGEIDETPFTALKPRDLFSKTNIPNDYKGLLPLHLSCSLRHCRVENIRRMVAANPVAVQCPDHRGWLPIHWCAYNNRHVDVLQLLIKSYSDGCYEANKKGKLPFQLAAFNRYTFMMDILYQENPDAIDSMDYNGNTPLHDAAKALNHEGVKKLLSYKPDLNRVRNFKEDLAIHKVFSFLPNEDSHHSTLEQMELHDVEFGNGDLTKSKAPRRLHHRQLETIKALLSVNPEIAALPDRHDSLPLHLAIFHNSPYEVIEYIYNIYPSAALIKDNEGKLPIQYVTNASVKKLLMKSSPPLIKAGLTDTFSRFIM